MVTLSRLYTRTGDAGTTRLGDMSQVPKTSPRIAAYGCVDELNSAIGLARSCGAAHDDVLARVQNDLFDLGADLCVPQGDAEEEERLRVQPRQVLFLERQIDGLTRGLAPLRSFVLPGGRLPAAWLHLARTVCRRAERAAWQLAEQEPVGEPVLQYLNRLSDLLFAMARAANDGGEADLLWEPGKGAADE
ncbi:MAG: cob(I)yrinic acid a,c-diamide adenosyltransferase [Gemmatimonadetes bacterium]|nr:cob(I)yrinic acid a,c-diamide adenosyltransferase [Gemmatimonadota bacterium]